MNLNSACCLSDAGPDKVTDGVYLRYYTAFSWNVICLLSTAQPSTQIHLYVIISCGYLSAVASAPKGIAKSRRAAIVMKLMYSAVQMNEGRTVRMWAESRRATCLWHWEKGSWVMGGGEGGRWWWRRIQGGRSGLYLLSLWSRSWRPLSHHVLRCIRSDGGTQYSITPSLSLSITHTHIKSIRTNYDGQLVYQVSISARDNVGRDIQGKHSLSQLLQLESGVNCCAGEVL